MGTYIIISLSAGAGGVDAAADFSTKMPASAKKTTFLACRQSTYTHTFFCTPSDLHRR